MTATDPTILGPAAESRRRAARAAGFGLLLMAVFGVHLLVVGSLFLQSRLIPALVGLLVILAGCGYLIDAFGTILVPGYDFSAAMYAFVGEVLLIYWLLFGRGWAGPTTGKAEDPRPSRGAQPSR